MDFRVRVPLWTILVGQCVLVAAVFTTLIAVFSTQMYSMTKSQVEERLTARLSTVREAALKPFVITQNAAETLAATVKMDPHTYRVSGNSTAMTKDGKFLRIAGSLLSSSGGFVEYISQISDDGVVERKGLFTMGVAQPISINPLDNFSYISGAIARDSLSIKIARNSAYATAAANTIPETLWLANYNNVSSGRYGGPYTFTRDPVVEPRLSDNVTIRSWSTFAIENNGQFIDDFPYSLLSSFTIVLEQDGNTSSAPEHYLHRFPNTWIVSACANLRSIQPILLDLIVTEDGFSALYDVSYVQTYSNSGHQQNEIILLATSRADLEVLEPSSKTFYNAFNTPYPRLNTWFAACFEDSSRRFAGSFGSSSSASVNTNNTNSLVVAQRSVSHSFTHRDRFLSYVHIYLPVGGLVASAASLASTADDDSGNLRLFAIVSTPKAHYFGDQNRVQNIMIAVGVVCAIIITSFCVALVVAIVMPLREIRSNMALAAHLKNDRVVATSSSLVEIDKVCDAFLKMNKLLLEARAFIPASMLVRTSDEDNDDENPDDDDLDDDYENENGNLSPRKRNAARKKKHRLVDEDDVEENEEGDYGGTTAGGDSVDEFYDDDDEGDFSFSRSGSRSRSRRHSSANECTSTNTDTSPTTRKPSQYGINNNGKNGSFPTIHRVSKSATGASSPSPAAGATARNSKEIAATSSVKISGSTTSVSTTSSLTRKRTSGFFGSSTRSKNKGGQLGMSLSGSSSTTMLKNRRVAVLCINVRGFTTLSAFSIDSLPAHATLLLDTVSSAANAERGVIDSFHGDHFVLSFNAVKTAASPAKKATLCAMAVANALEGTPFACLSMGASSGTAIVGALGNSSQRRLSIVGPCYVKALRLQRASAQLERSVDPLFFVPPTNVGTLLPASPHNNNNNSIHTPLGNRSATNFNTPSRFYSRGATGGNNNNTHNNNHHGDELNTTRHSSYPNCFYLLIDKTSYAESRDVAETLLVGSLATPIRTRTLASVMKKMTSLFTTRGGGAVTGAGGRSVMPASSSLPAKPSAPSVFPSMPSMPSCESESPLTGIKTRSSAFTGQGIRTVQSMSLTPQQQAQFRQQVANDNSESSPVNTNDTSLADGSRSVNLSISGLVGHHVAAHSSVTALHHVQVRPANKPTTTAVVEDPTEANLLLAEDITLAQQTTIDEDKGSPLIFARNGALFENTTTTDKESDAFSSPNAQMLPNFPAHIDNFEPQDKREKVTKIVGAVIDGVDDADSDDGINNQREENAETPIGMVRNGKDSSPQTPATIRRSSTKTVSTNTVTVIADTPPLPHASGSTPTAFARSRSQSSIANRESNLDADHDLPKAINVSSGKRQNDARKHSIPTPISLSVVAGGNNGTTQTNMVKPITSSSETNKPERHANISSPTKLIAGPAITVYAVLKLRTYNQRRHAVQQMNHLYNHPEFRGGAEKTVGDAGNGGDSTTMSSITTTEAAVSELDHDEWMYEVQKKNDNDVFRFVNTATESLQKGDLESAVNAAIERSERGAAKWESDKQDLQKRLDGQQASPGGMSNHQQQSLLLTVPPRDVVVLNLAVSTLKTALAFSSSSSQTVSPSAAVDCNASSVFGADMSTNTHSSSLHRTTVDGVLENLSIHHHQRHLHAQSPIIRPEELLVFFEGISLASTFHITQLLAKQNSTSTPLSPVEFNMQASSKAFSSSSPNHTGLSPRTAAALTRNFGGFKSRKGFESAADNDGDSGDEGLVRQQSSSGWNNVISKISVIANSNNTHGSNTQASGANSISQMSLPPLTNIEAAELAMWLRVCKIVAVVGGGGKQFVAATSFQ